jgi:[acyl-carrier-protein] S-malonyltransferase
MGAAIYKASDAARKTYEEASAVLGFDLAKICFEGPEKKINQTEYTQPAILTTSIALFRALGPSLKNCCAVAGHSLGEYTALVVAGAIEFRDAVSIVSQRGRFMQEAVEAGRGGMVAVVGLSGDAVRAICEKAAVEGGSIVTPANFNAPDQVVIAGEQDGLKRAMALATNAGAKRVIPLAVSVPSHSPLMKPACQRLRAVLDQIPGRDLAFPLVNNLAAKTITTWAEAKSSLVDQLAYPLLWNQSVQTIQTLGATLFIEIGPSRVLSGLLKRIDRSIRVVNAEDPEGIEKVRLSL